MKIDIIITSSEEPIDLPRLEEYLRGQNGLGEVTLHKVNQQTMSIHDAVQFAVQHPDALAALAMGIGTFIASLGRRAKIKILKDGTVIGENLASKDAARIAEALKRA